MLLPVLVLLKALCDDRFMLVEEFTREFPEWRYRCYKRGENLEFKSIGFIFPIEEVYERITFPLEQSFERSTDHP